MPADPVVETIDMQATADLRVRMCGQGEPLLVLLHGMGATGDVWDGLDPVLRAQWPGSWVVPDLPGHGGSARLPAYTFRDLAAAVARIIPPDGPVMVLGHSLGGVVALALASGQFGVQVEAVCALGVKLHWSPEELAKAAALSKRPTPSFLSRDEAAERHLKQSGLIHLATIGSVPNEALAFRNGEWSTTFDPLALAVGAPDMPDLLTAACSRVVLAAGASDPMCKTVDLLALRPDSVVIPGVGHNAHVENPEAMWPLLQYFLEQRPQV